ncbi:MAG TPA: double zinc ribbon domain-containing protein [Ktedonobacterales bacterium]|jgi:ComF family protein
MAGVTSLTRSLLDLVFPPRCVNCQTLGALLCERCLASIAIPQAPLCTRCGRPLLTPRTDQQCELCASGRGPVHLTSLRAATVYDGAIRAAILAYKFRGVHRLAEPLSEMLAGAYHREGLTADLVTHVPLHATRRRQRGYDQSQLLARETARRLSLPFLPDAVKRVRATEPQTSLQGDQRIVNVAQAFALANASVVERIKDRRILLIDDVTATGSTLDATTAALAEAGAAAIIGLALSRPNGNTIS